MRILLVLGLLMPAAEAMSQALDERDPTTAAVVVYSTSYAIERWESYCAAEHPAFSAAIADARSDWMATHDALISKAATLLQSTLTRDERMQIAVQTRLTNDEFEQGLAAAPPQASRRWCEESPARIRAERLDLTRRVNLVDALATVQAQAGS